MPQPPKSAHTVQLFGYEDSQPTRAALRFFKERRVEVHFVNLKQRPIALGELRRFVERLGAVSLLDPASKPYRDQGLQYLALDEAGVVGRVLANPRLLRLPLVRHGNDVTAGPAEAAWRAWLAPPT
jgi:arsenate reductase-like glutaredoxin family protein